MSVMCGRLGNSRRGCSLFVACCWGVIIIEVDDYGGYGEFVDYEEFVDYGDYGGNCGAPGPDPFIITNYRFRHRLYI